MTTTTPQTARPPHPVSILGGVTVAAAGAATLYITTTPLIGGVYTLMLGFNLIVDRLRWDNHRCPHCKPFLSDTEFEYRGHRSLGANLVVYAVADTVVPVLAAVYLVASGDASASSIVGALGGALAFTVGTNAYMVDMHEYLCHRHSRSDLTPPDQRN